MKKDNRYLVIGMLSESRELISQINRKVKEVLIELDFGENDEYYHEPYSKTLLPTDKAFYTFTCINHSCTGGFYNFTEYLDRAIRGNKKFVEGRISCDTWQDRERVGQNKCLSIVNFKITVDYNDSESK
mgnify:CR=1 FL=1